MPSIFTLPCNFYQDKPSSLEFPFASKKPADSRNCKIHPPLYPDGIEQAVGLYREMELWENRIGLNQNQSYPRSFTLG